jgi:hypothetical protein
MWSLTQEDNPPVDTSGDMPTLSVEDYVKAARALGRDARAQTMPFRGATKPNVFVHERGSQANITRWLKELQEPSISMTVPDAPWHDVEGLLEESADGRLNVKATATGIFCIWNAANSNVRVKAGDRVAEVNGAVLDETVLRELRGMGATVTTLKLARQCPNAGQLAVLDRVASRASCEWFEEWAGTAATSTEEPLFDLVHGEPGTGKSRVIAWQRELFEDVLGWDHGAQFVCLAYQNAMAANIDGHTIHHWGGIPAQDNNEERRSKPADIDELFIRCQSLRWIL